MEKQCKIIFSHSIARKLIKAGCVLVDIKPSKTEENNSVFVFEVNDLFNIKMTEFSKSKV